MHRSMSLVAGQRALCIQVEDEDNVRFSVKTAPTVMNPLPHLPPDESTFLKVRHHVFVA